jgi:hypothetical protein
VSATWLSIVSGLIAAVSALAGALLSNYLGQKERAQQQAFRIAQETRDFLIARGEYLYVELDRIDRYVEDHCRLIQALCRSEIRRDAFRDLRRDRLDERGKFNVARVKLNVRAFFPALREDYEALAENIWRIDTLDEALLDAETLDAALLFKANADSIRLQTLVATSGEELRAKLAQLLAETFASRAGAAGTDPGWARATG